MTTGHVDIHRTAGGASLVLFAMCLGLGLNYLFGVFIARWLGADAFGLYAVGVAVFGAVSVLAVLALDNAVLRYLPQLKAREPEQRGAFIKASLVAVAVAGSLAAALLYAFGEALALRFFGKDELAPVLKAFALAVPAYGCAAVLLGALQALHDLRWRVSIKYFAEPVARFALTAVLIWAGWGLESALAGFVAALWLSVLLAGIGIGRMGVLRSAQPVPYPWRALAAHAGPLVVGLSVSLIAVKADVLLLGLYVDPAVVGVYAAAFQTAAILSIVMQAVESVLAPLWSEKIETGNREEIRSLYALGNRWVTMTALPLVTLYLLLAEAILGIYGEEFKSGATALRLLAIAQFVNLATGSSNYLLMLAGNTRQVMWSALLYGGLLLALNLALVPRLGITGAALAVLGASAVINLVRLWQVYVLMGIHPYELNLAKPLCAALAVGALAILLETAWLDSAAAIGAIAFAAYAVLLHLLGLEADDKRALAGVLRRPFQGG